MDPVPPSPQPDNTAVPQPGWELSLRKVGFGVFLSAAIALFGYATLFGAPKKEFDNLIRFAIAFCAVAMIIFVLDKIREHFKGSKAVSWVVRCVMIAWILIVPIMLIIWVGAFIGRDIGIIPPVRTEPSSYLLRPSGNAASEGISYDPKTILRRVDGRATSFHVVQDSSHMGRLEGIYVEFGPGEDEIDAELVLPYEVERIPHRVRLFRVKKAFDFVD